MNGIDIFYVLLFGKTILITPLPIDISKLYQLQLERPIFALTSGAAVEIEISSMIPKALGPVESIEYAKKTFPKGCVSAKLTQSRGTQESEIRSMGNVVGMKGGFRLLLESATNIPLDVRYDRLEILSCKPIYRTRIYWRNVHEL